MAAEDILTTSRLPGLLRLTPATRHLIYQYAGLPYKDDYGTPSPAVYDLGDPSSFRATRTYSELEEGFQTFHGLMLCCRTVYAKTSALLYSENWFVIRYQPRCTLAPLRDLTPRSLSHLRRLKIVLNQTSCHEQKTGVEGEGGCCGADHKTKSTPCCRPYWHEFDHDLPLDAWSAKSKTAIRDWHATAAYLASYIAPGQLELSLVCDVQHDDLEAAQLVLDGLRLLPRVKDCHLRLCGTREPRLQNLAEETGLQVRGLNPARPSPVSPNPRLLNLPQELRLRILSYTDLITPWKEVVWRRRASGGYRIEKVPCYVLLQKADCEPRFHYGCQFGQCWAGISPQPSVGCFCRRRHTAFSSRCRCWAPPTSLFLICRTLYADATRVFYSQNRFIVIDGPTSSPYYPWPPEDYPHDTFAASEFLRRVVPRHCLGYICLLEIAFAPFTHLSRPRDGHPALQDWSETLDWARNHLTLPALTLRVVFAGNSDFEPKGSGGMTRAQGKEVLATYNAILAPVARCLDPTCEGGLARFYAALAWPLRWTLRVGLRLAEQGEQGYVWLKGRDRELKKRVEQTVMGERYEGVCGAATREPEESVWTFSCLAHQY